MLFFGHIGIAAAINEGINYKFKKERIQLQKTGIDKYYLLHYFIISIMATFVDIIDKPMAVYIFPEYHSGRIFCHTIIFNFALIMIGYIFFKKYWSYWILLLSHLLLDFIYDYSFIYNLCYPFLGTFPSSHIAGFHGMVDYVGMILAKIDMIGIIFEFVGFIILCLLIYRDRKRANINANINSNINASSSSKYTLAPTSSK
ncbi:MAG: hypothetical protein HQK49_15010 [Oligoflexia bacterium]|nr:hypothetical protein [Oligoflexia bacterium]